MSFRDRMKKKKKSFKKQFSKPPKSSKGRFPTIFNKKKIPEGIGTYFCKEGEHLADIIPWEVGPDMPLDYETLQPVVKKGGFAYVLDLWVHTNVGSMKKPFVCPYENFGLPCPICEYIKANRLSKEDWKIVSPKRRSIYLVWSRKNREEEKKGIQIFDSSHFLMEEKIAEIAKLPKGGGSIVFSDEDEGKTIAWTRKGGKESTRYIGHRLIDRESPIPDKILDQSFSLDQVINMHPTYEEIEKECRGTLPGQSSDDDVPFDDDDADDIPRKKKGKKKKKKKKKLKSSKSSEASKPDKKKKKKKKKKSK